MTNNKCDVCEARTAYDFNGDNFSTVVKAHWVIGGAIICRTCVEEIIKSTHKEVKTGRVHIKTSMKMRNPHFEKGEHIKHKEGNI